MEERLKGLKRAMQKTTFQHLAFTEQHRQTVQHQLSATDLLTEILALLTTQKTGTALTELLHIKGTPLIQQNEGLLYTTLHQAELDGYVEAYWTDTMEKYYQMTAKGQKLLHQKQERSPKGFFKGGFVHE
ncbi:helix-turn-helix transcriptional regulator [Lysinibacillus piscis]|uniref:PadR family transcriptional regulator n=1 Tax=Lysinibacillus piscis TaxID=2518931 RepID=A0ABQ5NMM0_9BACI|nr:helix-turn-helix transcriptional regulator [Lysinibacillus sp. KH24]GLC89552.1 PadR family transcriptional regulator [Lysinibacillus sp. KH24]